MKELMKRLGKKVQTLWKKIFGKKKSDLWKNDQVQIKILSKENMPDNEWEQLLAFFDDEELETPAEEILSKAQSQEFSASIPLTLLPKHYWCKTLLLTLAANQPYDYRAIDMSQFEERSLVHYIIGCTCSKETLHQQYVEATGEDDDIEDLWNGDWCSSVMGPANLYYYEELDHWEVDYD